MRLLALTILGSALLLSVIYGGFIAGIVFREPDVCFLLAMGRWIVNHEQIPLVDPFSYTYSVFPNGNAYVVYQWLYEILIYSVQAVFGLIALLVFTAIVLSITFIVMPMRLFAIGGGNLVLGSFITVLVMLGTLSHLSVRPELFSFLFTAVVLELLARLSGRQSLTSIDWRFVGVLFLLVVLWTNLHCLFIFYFVLVGFFALCLGAYSLVTREALDGRFKSASAAVVAGALATMINPYGITIWPFTFCMLTDPINKTINELRPISTAVFKNVLDYPWLLLAFVALVVFIFSLRKKIESGSQLYFLLLIPAAISMSLLAVRTFPLAALLMCCGLAFSPILRLADGRLDRLSKQCLIAIAPLGLWWFLSVCTFGGFGAYILAAHVVPPTIPEGSAAFHPPFDAIEHLEKLSAESQPKGNMLNDSHYGAVMMWQMKNPPKVFVDPRYFLYNVPLMNDYWDMVLYRNKPEALLDKYKISWVFVPASTALARELSTQPSWHVLYSDKDAAIITREKWQKDDRLLP